MTNVNYGDGQTQSYGFDAMGNRTQKQDSVAGTENYTYNAANMLLSRNGAGYTNDANGNTLTGGGRTNTWDSQNRLIQCVNGGTTSTFVYGADGLRRRSTVNNTTTDFVLDNSMFIRERRNGNNVATYLMGARGPEYRRDDSTGNVRWYLYDGLGSVLGEVDPNGIITSSRKFDVYGLVRGGNNPSGTSSHKFVGSLGHPSEDNTGLIYMRARYYDPSLGRFASEDPAKSGTNWYKYCNDNPVNCVDESGKFSILGTLLFVIGLMLILDAALGLAKFFSGFKKGFIETRIEQARDALFPHYESGMIPLAAYQLMLDAARHKAELEILSMSLTKCVALLFVPVNGPRLFELVLGTVCAAVGVLIWINEA